MEIQQLCRWTKWTLSISRPRTTPQRKTPASVLTICGSGAWTREKLAAIARVTLSGREQVVLIRPYDQGLLLPHALLSGEVREVGRVWARHCVRGSGAGGCSGRELHGGRCVRRSSPSNFIDNYKEQVLALIETKRAGATPPAGG